MRFPHICILLCLLLLPLLHVWGKPVNKTPYRIPGKKEYLKRLAAAKMTAEKERSKEPLCLSCTITVFLEKDHSGRIDFIEEYYLPVSTKVPLRKDFTHTFVELILPDGSYRSYISPGKVPGIGETLVYVKYSRRIPPADTLHFLLDLVLNLHCKVQETRVRIFNVKFEKLYHSILPPRDETSVGITRIGRFSYLLKQVPGLQKKAQELLLRISFHPDWNTFGERYFERYFSVKKLPDPLLKKALQLKKEKELSSEKKLQILASLLPFPPKNSKADLLTFTALLAEAGKKAGIEVFPVLASPPPPLNLTVAGDLFTDIFLVLRQGEKEVYRSPGKKALEGIPEGFHGGTALILRGHSCQLRKIDLLSGKKRP